MMIEFTAKTLTPQKAAEGRRGPQRAAERVGIRGRLRHHESYESDESDESMERLESFRLLFIKYLRYSIHGACENGRV
jgi:hypothetical protein